MAFVNLSFEVLKVIVGDASGNADPLLRYAWG
jgi:hypothetical protein